MNYSIRARKKDIMFETKLQVVVYSGEIGDRCFEIGKLGKKGYEIIFSQWFDSSRIHVHVINDTMYIYFDNEEVIELIKEELTKAGIEVKYHDSTATVR